jgi:steroid 5-alpha reductase family enzyme
LASKTAAIRRTKIVATLGPAWEQPEQMRALLDAGVNVIRINSSHGSSEIRSRWITTLQEVQRLGVWFSLGVASGDATRGVIIATLVGIWGARLGAYLTSRVLRESEDGRYRHLRNALGGWTQPVMFVFFQVQALWGLMFALPMWAAAQSTNPAIAWHDWLGIGVWLLAFTGEAVSDRQLNRFRRDPANEGKVCQVGLWRYSRHPNYFFEWLHWIAWPVMGIGLPYGAALWLAPAGMLWLVLRVTGIPPTEAQAVRSRGDDYRAYQRSTNAFFPGPPRLEREVFLS